MSAELEWISPVPANDGQELSLCGEPVSVGHDRDDVSPARATERVYRQAGSTFPAFPGSSCVMAAAGQPARDALSDVAALPGGGPRLDRHLHPEVRVLVVDDCTLYRDYMAEVFAADDAPRPAAAWDLESLLAALTENRPNLVLLNLDTRDSVMLLRATFEICPNAKVIVLGMAEDDEAGIVACAEAGVAGYHLRTESIDDLLDLIGRVLDGETSCSPRVSAILLRRLSALATQRQSVSNDLVLTLREAQILRMLEMGLSNRDIADQLCIAIHTVKNHVHNLLAKLGVRTRAQAAARFRTVVFTEVDLED